MFGFDSRTPVDPPSPLHFNKGEVGVTSRTVPPPPYIHTHAYMCIYTVSDFHPYVMDGTTNVDTPSTGVGRGKWAQSPLVCSTPAVRVDMCTESGSQGELSEDQVLLMF